MTRKKQSRCSNCHQLRTLVEGTSYCRSCFAVLHGTTIVIEER